MDVSAAIKKRRAFRALTSFKVTDDFIHDLSEHAGLAQSCFNKQPWNFIFVRGENVLKKIYKTLSAGNQWAAHAPLIIAVYSKAKDDCVIEDRVYNMLDTGFAVQNLILRATELGYVAHPIAGYDQKKVAKTLKIQDEYQVITLVIVGKHDISDMSYLNEHQRDTENKRPDRKDIGEYTHIDGFKSNI